MQCGANVKSLRKTKIICTLGPSTNDLDKIKAVVQSGMNVARLNFSHGTHEEHKRLIQLVRKACSEFGVEVGLMLDTKGPEIRIGPIKNKQVELIPGQQFILTNRRIEGDEREVQVSYDELPGLVKYGDNILLSDGLISLSVIESDGTNIISRVTHGGLLKERKQVNLPEVRANLPFLSQKDIDDLNFAIANNMDFVAASFVRSAADVNSIREILGQENSRIDIIAKIESQEGIDHLEEIIRVSDGVMVARGDLGVEIPTEEVPLVQKTVIQKCRARGKPVIIATQMLESMVYNPRPTRAEASDVANSIFDGTDAVMLSAETATGSYPAEAVETMARIARRTEEVLPYEEMLRLKGRFSGTLTATEALSHAACTVAMNLGASVIIAATKSGQVARMVAKYRPRAPIIAATPSPEVMKKLTLVWGVLPILVKETQRTDTMIEEALNMALDCEAISPGDLAVITAGTPGVPGGTSLVQTREVGHKKT